MTFGDVTATNLGNYALSGASLKTALDSITLSGSAAMPGAVHLIPTGNGQQVMVIQTNTESAE